MNLKFIFIFMITIFLVATISADLGTFKQNECVNIRTILNSTEVNISSISYPNGTVLYLDTAMTANGKTFNYTFCDTLPLGEYIYDYYDVDNDKGYSNSFEISYGGDKFDMTQGIILLGLFGFMGLLFGISYTFSKEKWKLKSFFQMMSLSMGIVLLNSIRILTGTSSNLQKMGTVALIIGIVVLSFMIGYILILYTIEIFNYFKKKNRNKWEIGDSYE